MQFRRSGQRDERRRRVLLEDSLAASSDDEAAFAGDSRSSRSGSASSPGEGKRYSDAARPERQPRVTDLVPVRAWTLSVLLLLQLSVVAALVGLDGQVGEWSRVAGRANLAALDFAAPGSLASWFGSLLLTTAAGYCLLVFLLRRHKVDDYRGRYRYWLVAVLLLMLGSIDAVTGVHRVFGGLIARLSGVLTVGDGAAWSLILAGLLYGALVLRGVFEIRHSRGALATLLLAVAAYGVAVAALAKLFPMYDAVGRLTGNVALLLGHVLTLYAVLIFARHVLLDAQGKLAQRAPRRKKKRDSGAAKVTSSGEAASDSSRSGKRRVDAAHRSDTEASEDRSSATSKPKESAEPKRSGASLSTSGQKSPPTKPAVDDDEFDNEFNSGAKLSKAERRRLRKLQRRAARA